MIYVAPHGLQLNFVIVLTDFYPKQLDQRLVAKIPANQLINVPQPLAHLIVTSLRVHHLVLALAPPSQHSLLNFAALLRAKAQRLPVLKCLP